jgi:hypothetical protein
MPRQSHARIQSTITGQAGKLGAIEAHERNVIAITRRMHTLNAKIRTLSKQLADARTELRAKRRELRAVLQRDSSITEDSEILEPAGKADAADAASHRAETRRR